MRCEKFVSVKKKGESSDVSSGRHHGFFFFFWSNPFMLLHYSPAAIPTKPIRFFKTKLYKNQKS